MIGMTKQVDSVVKQTLKKAEDIYKRSFPEIEIRNDIKGKCGGMFCRSISHKYLRFNPVLWHENRETYDDTVVHEVAHYIQNELYPYSKPHGPEWKSVMTRLGAKPERCHKMKVTSTRKTFTYKCNCREVELTSIRHNRCQKKGVVYTCKKCGGRLKFVG